jgi:FAD/FMN-containing dehydrogenase
MNAPVALTPELLTQLTAIVGENRIKTDADSLENWGKIIPSILIRTHQSSFFHQRLNKFKVVKLANQFNIAITPSGGRTGLSAGAVATNGEIVISMDKMNQILEFFPADRMVRVQAGVVTEQLQNYAEEQGMYYPVDFASAGSSQIGGNIGTNAGGIKVIKYGMTRNWVLGLTVVTGKGDILRLNKGMIKNATGYALQHLFIGGEGTLGLVTEAEIKLERQPQNLQVMVLGVPDFDAVMPVLHAFQKNRLNCI